MSATLAVIVCAALLQSCNSESMYEEPAYGYYTAEEINVIKAMAEAYGLSIELDENYYGPKKTFPEFEEEMQSYADMLGEYEIVLEEGENNTFIANKKGDDLSRMSTRSTETWNDTFKKGIYTFTLTIEWKESTDNKMPGYASGYIKASCDSGDYFGGLHCTLGSKGSETVLFSGYISLPGYTYSITNGRLNIRTKIGSFLFEPFYV